MLTGKGLLLLKTFCSSWPKGSQPNSKDARKSTPVIFSEVGVVVVYVCVCMGRGVRENEREGYGWVIKIVQKGYSRRMRVETVRSIYQFLNKHVNYS